MKNEKVRFMKKTYKTPQMEVVKIQTNQQVLTASVPMSGQNATGPGLSRSYDWEDEY